MYCWQRIWRQSARANAQWFLLFVLSELHSDAPEQTPQSTTTRQNLKDENLRLELVEVRGGSLSGILCSRVDSATRPAFPLAFQFSCLVFSYFSFSFSSFLFFFFLKSLFYSASLKHYTRKNYRGSTRIGVFLVPHY